jgi:hypothetical protein
MALIQADGTGLATANCYISEAELDAYALMFNIDLSAYTTEQKQASILKSANYFIDAKHCIAGVKISSTQGMKFYTDIATFDIASKDVKTVNSITAILDLQGKLFVETSVEDKNGEIKSQMDKLDVLETKTEFVEGTAIVGGTYDTQIADDLLRPYLAFGGGISLVNT